MPGSLCRLEARSPVNHITVFVESADSHVHVRLYTNGALSGRLSFLPREFFEFDRALQRSYGVRYVLENTTLLESVRDAR